MPPKRRAAEQPSSANSPSTKRSKPDSSHKGDAADSPSVRRSPRKAAQQKQPPPSKPETKSPRSRKVAGKKVGLKSWLSNGSAKQEEKIDKVVEAAVDVAEDADRQRDSEESEAGGKKEEDEAQEIFAPPLKVKTKVEAEAQSKSSRKVKEEQELEDPSGDETALKSQVRAKTELQSPLSPKKETKDSAGKKDQTSTQSPAKKGKKESGVAAKPKDQSNPDLFVQSPPPSKTKPTTKPSKDMSTPLAGRASGLRHFIGAHVSIAKGVQNGVLNAHHIGANAFALFLKSQRKWDNPALQEDSVKLWKKECTDHSYASDKHVLPHGSYLVNLASQTAEQHDKSVASFVDDLQRCERLGIALYNFHPGNSNGASKEVACRKIAEAINLAHSKTKTVIPVLETMASNKPTSNTVGGRFEELAQIIEHVKDKSRIGVCIDTCHTFAAGYDIVSRDGFNKTMAEFDRIVGRKYLRAWHLNDSKAVQGSGRDLHANIGTGFIGLRGFWNVMNMDIWGAGVGVTDMPLVLETPIDEQGGGMVPQPAGKKGEKGKEKPKKPEEDKGIWAREIKLLESLIGMDVDGDEFKRLEKELRERGKGQRGKMQLSVDKMLAKGKGNAKKQKGGDEGEDSD